MIPALLVPLDGSSFSEDALPLARRLASRLSAEVHLVHVIRPAPDFDLKQPGDDLEWNAKVREGAEAHLGEIAESMKSEGIRARVAVLEGRVVDALDGYLRENSIPLAVMTTHGSGGLRRWWLGSVADGLLRGGSANILLVRPWDDTDERDAEAPAFRHLVVPLDGSRAAEAALPPALDLARHFDARVSLLRVVPAPLEVTSIYGVPGVRMEGDADRERMKRAKAYLEEVARRSGPEVESKAIEHGAAAEGVIEGARELGGDLLVISTHGHGGLTRVVLGSVADKVVRGTALPVLVVRPQED
jgi:nucleotide-binding universal stress UspA family protein